MRRYTILILALLYYLGLHNGQLAIFRNNTAQPLEVFPYSSDIFPEADRAALKKGIPFQDSQTLHRLLEDYLS